jgi:hypothetical protein
LSQKLKQVQNVDEKKVKQQEQSLLKKEKRDEDFIAPKELERKPAATKEISMGELKEKFKQKGKKRKIDEATFIE